MARRLKVFSWSDGFHSWTVATGSRPKALAAWGSEQDLFKSGLAHEITEGPEHAAALADPETVIRTGVAIDPGAIERIAPRPARDTLKRKRDAERLARLRERMAEADAALAATVKALETRRRALDRQESAARADRDKTVRGLEAALRALEGSG